MTTIRAFFSKLGHFFPVFEKGQGRPPRLVARLGIMKMPPPVNVKSFNSMPFKGAKAYVNISKVSMTEAVED